MTRFWYYSNLFIKLADVMNSGGYGGNGRIDFHQVSHLAMPDPISCMFFPSISSMSHVELVQVLVVELNRDSLYHDDCPEHRELHRLYTRVAHESNT
jgi:hypothetical protein